MKLIQYFSFITVFFWFVIGTIQNLLAPILLSTPFPALAFASIPAICFFIALTYKVITSQSIEIKLLLIYFSIVFLLTLIFIVVLSGDQTLINRNIGIVIRWLVFLSCGYGLVRYYQNYRVRFLIFSFISWSLFYLFIIVFGDFSTFTLPYVDIYFSNVESENKVNLRHSLTDFFAMLSLGLCILLRKSNNWLYFFFVLGMLGVYFLGGRASMLSYFIVIVPLIYAANPKIFKLNLLIFIFLSVLLVLLSLNFEYLSVSFSSIYENSPLFNLSEDSSLLEREYLFDAGIKGIIENPLLGDYGGHLSHSISGTYIHGFLSYYRQFGLLAFILYITIYINAAVYLYKYKKQIFPIVMYLLLLSIFSKAYNWGWEWLILGFVFSIQKNKNEAV